MRRIIFSVMLFLLSAHCRSSELALNYPNFVSIVSRSTLVGMQLAIRQEQQLGNVSDAIANCVQALDESSYTPTIASLLPDMMTESDAQIIETFFTTALGKKYANYLLMQLYLSLNEKPPEPLPNFSDEEYKELEKFDQMGAGNKRFMNKPWGSPAVRKAIFAQMLSLLRACSAE